MMHTRHQHLYKSELGALLPTQMTVGMAEVADKRSLWSTMKHAERKKFLGRHWFPAVKGPRGRFYIVDHHHLGRALMDDGVKQCQVVLLKDLSHLALAEFWVVMDHHQWVHPYDARGRRRPVKELPQSLEELVDDPYRSLAGEVRNAGGYPKDATPFAEFLWADFFRRRIAARVVMQHPDEALRMALNLCHTPEAAHLPGWTGPINSHDAQVSG